MPIADILGHREVVWTYTANGNEKNISGGMYGHSHNGIVGLFDRIELAYTNDFTGSTTYGAKVLLFENMKMALSAGVVNYDCHRADPYVVGRMDFDKLRVHAGIIRDDRHRIMLGADFDFGKGVSGMVDWVSGPSNYVSLGFNWNVPNVPGLAIMPMIGLPSKRGDGLPTL